MRVDGIEGNKCGWGEVGNGGSYNNGVTGGGGGVV